MSIMKRLEEEFNCIDDKQPENGQKVTGYCEPQRGSDFEDEVIYEDGKFYHKGKEVRCYYWKV